MIRAGGSERERGKQGGREEGTGRTHPSLMVIFRSSSGLVLTVFTPLIALTTVDLPWATWPMVPMLMVACLEMTSGVSGVSVEGSGIG